ncbi:MAG: alpha/beta hydrolase [Leptolyngbyaceae cyanobacterium bins.349]|nr:alpha/beta hydrolase [Leptolyngbyaceae cyanobacterium bins.349]
MSQVPEAIWLNVSPAVQGFDRPLLKKLAQHCSVAQWEFCQSLDEPLSLEVALVLLHDYLKHHDQPVHLLGHSTGGLLALLYARKYPERVRSLSLLAVGVHPAVDWQAHYYAQLQLLPCSREMLLTQTVYTLFGYQSAPVTRELRHLLERDLKHSLSPHTLYHRVSFFPAGVPVPLLVCGSQTDSIVDPTQIEGWQTWLKDCDRLWLCPDGRYFFHYFQPQDVSQQIVNFWSAQDARACASKHRESSARTSALSPQRNRQNQIPQSS